MGNAPQKFIGMPFLLQREGVWVGRSHQAYLGCLDLPLPFAGGFDEGAFTSTAAPWRLL
jgi:hypothetical protein